MSNANTKKAIARAIVAMALSLAGIAGSIKLKSVGLISESPLVVFVSLSLLLGLFIAYSDRIESLNLKDLDLKLREMKQTEVSVKDVAAAILDVIETQSHTVMLESYDEDSANKAIERLKKLIE